MGSEYKQEMLERQNSNLSIRKQCELLSLSRSHLYYTASTESQANLSLMEKMDKQYIQTPFYGARKMRQWLASQGEFVNLKRVRRLMALVRWKTIYREPKTSIASPKAGKYPYLLRNLAVKEVNQVWATDITYIPMKKGFMYLVAVIDLHSRYVLNWSLSNTMPSQWCAQVLKETIERHGVPQISNTDQGSQFTSEAFVSILKENKI